MKQVMMIKFDSPKWRMIDEYKVANPFIDVGFRQVKDVVDLRVFDLLKMCIRDSLIIPLQRGK